MGQIGTGLKASNAIVKKPCKANSDIGMQRHEQKRNYLLECKEKGDGSLPRLYEELHRAVEGETIHEKQEPHKRNYPDVRQHGNRRGCLNVLDPLLSQPVQSFDQQQGSNHGQEGNREILPENSDGKEDFHDLPPRLLVKPLYLGFPEGTKEHPLRQLPQDAHKDQTHVEKQHQTDLGSGQINHGRVELASTAKCMVNHRQRREYTKPSVRLQPHHICYRPAKNWTIGLKTITKILTRILKTNSGFSYPIECNRQERNLGLALSRRSDSGFRREQTLDLALNLPSGDTCVLKSTRGAKKEGATRETNLIPSLIFLAMKEGMGVKTYEGRQHNHRAW